MTAKKSPSLVTTTSNPPPAMAMSMFFVGPPGKQVELIVVGKNPAGIILQLQDIFNRLPLRILQGFATELRDVPLGVFISPYSKVLQLNPTALAGAFYDASAKSLTVAETTPDNVRFPFKIGVAHEIGHAYVDVLVVDQTNANGTVSYAGFDTLIGDALKQHKANRFALLDEVVGSEILSATSEPLRERLHREHLVIKRLRQGEMRKEELQLLPEYKFHPMLVNRIEQLF